MRSSFLIDEAGKIVAALVRGQAGRHGPQGPKGLERGVKRRGARCAPYRAFFFFLFSVFVMRVEIRSKQPFFAFVSLIAQKSL
jgi:hypothetical protein